MCVDCKWNEANPIIQLWKPNSGQITQTTYPICKLVNEKMQRPSTQFAITGELTP